MKQQKIAKQFILFAIINLFSITVWAGATPSPDNPNLQQVTSRVYALIGDMAVPNENNRGFICNSAFVITDKGVVVVDPGGSLQVGRMVLNEIRKLTDKPITHIINTHHHADHWMGNHAFAHLKPKPIIIGHSYMRDKANEIGAQWLTIIGNLTKGANKGTRVVVPDKVVSADQTFNIGNQVFQLIHPGHAHTKGDLAVYLPEEKTLLTGDILFYKRTPGFQDASPLGNLAALEKLHKLDIKHVVPGHGPVTNKLGINYMISYVKLLHREVKKYYNEGLQDFEMKDKIQVGHYRQMSGFNSRFGVNVNRMYMEVEQNDF